MWQVALLVIAVSLVALAVWRAISNDPLSKIARLRGHPLFGHLLQFPQLTQNLIDGYNKCGAIFRLSLPVRMVVIGDPQLSRKVFLQSSERVLIGSVLIPKSILKLPEKEWRPVRRRHNLFFSTAKVNNMLPAMISSAQKLVRHIQNEGTKYLNASQLFHEVTFDVLLRTTFSREFQESDRLLIESIKTLMANEYLVHTLIMQLHVGKFFPFPVIKNFRKAEQTAREICFDELDRRRKLINSGATPPEDFLTDLVTTLPVEANDPLPTDDGHVDDIMMFFGAGEDTTANSMLWILFCLCKHPEIMKKTVDEVLTAFPDPSDPVSVELIFSLSYLDKVCKESVRLYPVASGSRRVLLEPLDIGTTVLPKGTLVFINLAGMAHSPLYWEKPEEFYPEHFDEDAVNAREPGAYSPFGGGARGCIGYRMALLEQRVVITYLLRHFVIELQPGLENVGFVTHLVTRPAKDLFFKFTPRTF